MNIKNLDFRDKELAILRAAVDKAEKRAGERNVQSPLIKNILKITEDFIRDKKLVCYGGTAVNNILPKSDQFYNKRVEIPDYDVFSNNALEDAKELANLFYENGHTEVWAISGLHPGTFKIYVNFIAVADLTQLETVIFKKIQKKAIIHKGILYAPPNFLRMSMYLELSRPEGDTSRWEKILKRLILLNKNYPITTTRCKKSFFMRKYYGSDKKGKLIFDKTMDVFSEEGVVFFGGFALNLYAKYLNKTCEECEFNPDFEVLSLDPRKTALKLKKALEELFKKKDITISSESSISGKDSEYISVGRKYGLGELIANHYEVKVGLDTIAFIYEPMACHSFNTIKYNGEKLRIATIDTILSLYLAFLYANKPYYNHKRIACMSEFLFKVQAKNRLKQEGLLKRFSIECYGKQRTYNELKIEKAEKYKKIKRNTKAFEYNFLRYTPGNKYTKKNTHKRKPINKKTKRRVFNFLGIEI